MLTKFGSVLDVHLQLVGTPSVSHSETQIADQVQYLLCDLGVEVERYGDNVIAKAGSGPRLLLNSHLDTVPATSSWSLDPWTPVRKDGRVYGLGSNDAKASVAAMISAFAKVAEAKGPCEVVLLLCPEEETGGHGTEVAWPWLRDNRGWIPSGVVVGEPTGLDIGIAQRGLVVFELLATGDQCHAAHAQALSAVNPVWQLANDITALKALSWELEDGLLGTMSLQPTILTGGVAKNQVPGEAVATFDLRTVPGVRHEELLEEIQARVVSRVRPVSTRFLPYACPSDSAVVRAAEAARPASQKFGSGTLSDQAHFTGVHAIKCGPGLSARSHTADEYVLESEITEGAEFYWNLIQEFAKVVP